MNVCATLKGKNETMIVCVGRVWVSVYEKERESERAVLAAVSDFDPHRLAVSRQLTAWQLAR